MSLMSDPLAALAPLTSEEAALVCRIARDRGGLSISPDKRPLLEQRLLRRLKVTGHENYAGYLSDLQGPGAEGEIQAMIEALTTHTTSFFREAAQFDWLRQTGLPSRIAEGAGRERPLVLWSAACSSGLEMWTAAMVLDQMSATERRPLRWNVIGSDISAAILGRASEAIYTESEIAGLPEDYRRAYLLRSRKPRAGGHLYRIIPDLRRKARLYQANLVAQAPALDTRVDVAMLRNVLIYFDDAGRAAAIGNVCAQLHPGGFLLTGHTESLNPVPPDLTQVAPSIYRKG